MGKVVDVKTYHEVIQVILETDADKATLRDCLLEQGWTEIT